MGVNSLMLHLFVKLGFWWLVVRSDLIAKMTLARDRTAWELNGFFLGDGANKR